MLLSLLNTICVKNLVKISLVVFASIKNKQTNIQTYISNADQTYIKICKAKVNNLQNILVSTRFQYLLPSELHVH